MTRSLCTGRLPCWIVGGISWVLLLSLMACERRAPSSSSRAAPDTTSGPTPRQVSYDAEFRIHDGGRPRATLVAGQMEQYDTEDSTYTLLRSPSDSLRVRVYVFDENGDSSSTITANRVLLYSEENRFEAYGNVLVATNDDRTLRSEHLTWHEVDRKIRTQRFVRIRTPTEQVQGTGLVADEDLDTYSIGQFTARVEMDDESESSAEADTVGRAPPPDTGATPPPRPESDPVPDSLRR